MYFKIKSSKQSDNFLFSKFQKDIDLKHQSAFLKINSDTKMDDNIGSSCAEAKVVDLFTQNTNGLIIGNK